MLVLVPVRPGAGQRPPVLLPSQQWLVLEPLPQDPRSCRSSTCTLKPYGSPPLSPHCPHFSAGSNPKPVSSGLQGQVSICVLGEWEGRRGPPPCYLAPVRTSGRGRLSGPQPWAHPCSPRSRTGCPRGTPTIPRDPLASFPAGEGNGGGGGTVLELRPGSGRDPAQPLLYAPCPSLSQLTPPPFFPESSILWSLS